MTKTEKPDLLPVITPTGVPDTEPVEVKEEQVATTVSHATEVDLQDQIEAKPKLPATGDSTGGVPLLQLLNEGTKGPSSGQKLGARERLLLLTAAETPHGTETPAPAANELTKRIRDAIGPVAKQLSPEEIASVLGHPEWQDAVASLEISNHIGAPHFLLGAHLSRWMNNVEWKGASLDDVAASFKSANPLVSERFPYLDGDFISVLQSAHRFMPQWQNKPTARTSQSSWLDVARGNVEPVDQDTRVLDTALEELGKVPLSLPLTRQVGLRLKERQPFAHQNVVMVQHVLGQAQPQVDAMVEAGLDPSQAEYIGIPYRTGPAVQLTLERTFGMPVTIPPQGDIDAMWETVCAAVDRAYERHLKNGDPILVFDDGGYASKYIAQKYGDQAHLFKVVEQTTRGLTEISAIEDPQFSIVNVAGSFGKKFESAQVGDVVVQAIRNILDAMTTTPVRKDVLVVGGGKVGRAVAKSFVGDGARVHIYDPYLSPTERRELEALGYRVITDKAEAVRRKFLVVGCSGHRSINMEDFAEMSSPVFIASASSKRIEIDTIGDQATTDTGELRRILGARVGDQESYYYWLKDGRTVVAMADTLPVNFQDVNSIAPELIDHTMALMLLGGAQAVDSKAHGLEDLEPFAQFDLQAQMEGLRSGEPRSGEIAIRVGRETYCGSRELWDGIATSEATPPEVLDCIYEAFIEKEPMDPLLLRILDNQHELRDELIDKILSFPFLPHVARLAANRELSIDQQDRIIEWVWGAYEFAAAQSNEPRGRGPILVERAADGTHRYMEYRPPMQHEGVLTHLGAIMFPHRRCPPGFRTDMLMRKHLMGYPSSGNVHALRHPAWEADQLMELLDGASSVVSHVSKRPKDIQYARYAADVCEIARDHPSANDQVRDYANRVLLAVRDQAGPEIRERSIARWPMSVLGMRLPEYTSKPY